MLARECSDKNVAVVGYSEAFGAVLFGKAGKHSVQLFKNRYTRTGNPTDPGIPR